MQAGTKEDAFINLEFSSKHALKPVVGRVFSEEQLFMSESDGSSYPNGGLRNTHTAAAYMGWDRSSPPFIRGDTVYIPSTFAAWTGAALDYKTPLLKAQTAIDKAATRMCHHLGMSDVKSVHLNLGWEQEYFLVPLELYNKRPDLVQCGRTVFGQLPPRNQQNSDLYFGPISPRIKAYMAELQTELWRVGIAISVNHNEVAPCQHELSPIFSPVNVSVDQNIVCGEIMKTLAAKHNLAVMLHEKPFADINGSGKHANWSLGTDTGVNLCNPGKTEATEAAFAAMVAVIMHAFNNHQEVIRTGVGSNGNDFRLGGHEAPPAIISLATGVALGAHMEAIAAGGPLAGYDGGRKSPKKIDYGSASVVPATASVEDRNRTAPMPFCGNRFELRAVGSAQNPSFAMTCLAMCLAEGCDAVSDLVEQESMSIRAAVGKIVEVNKIIMFNGDGYSKEWHHEAEHVRKLKVLTTTVDALDIFNSDSVKKIFSKHAIYTPEEVDAVTEIMYQQYSNEVQIELGTMINMVNQGILPACAKDLKAYEGTNLAGPRAGVYEKVTKTLTTLNDLLAGFDTLESAKEAARYSVDTAKPGMVKARVAVEDCEKLMDKDLYPYPTYLDMLFPHHNQPSGFPNF